MASPKLTGLPPEVLVYMLSFMPYDSQAMLARTSKLLQVSVQSHLWAQIDLYPAGQREYFSNVAIPWRPSLFYRKSGFTRESGDFTFEERNTWQQLFNGREIARHVLSRLSCILRGNSSRSQTLSAHTKCFSAPTTFGNNVGELFRRQPLTPWEAITHFYNLEHLDLLAHHYPDRVQPPSLSPAPLTKLKSAKLWGYVPKNFVEQILRSAATLETLDLGLLDDPLSSIDWASRSGSAVDHFAFGSVVAPRPLLWVPQYMPALPCLTHLYLCRPTEPGTHHLNHVQPIHYNQATNQSCIDDWRRLIGASATTLQHLVLEQRRCALKPCMLNKDCLGLVQHFEQLDSQRLADMLEGLLLSTNFPRLERIDFAGVFMNSFPTDADTEAREKLVRACQTKKIAYTFCPARWCKYGQDGVVRPTDGMG